MLNDNNDNVDENENEHSINMNLNINEFDNLNSNRQNDDTEVITSNRDRVGQTVNKSIDTLDPINNYNNEEHTGIDSKYGGLPRGEKNATINSNNSKRDDQTQNTQNANRQQLEIDSRDNRSFKSFNNLVTLNYISVCQHCKESFNSNENLPYLLKCGHFFCKFCIVNNFTNSRKEIICPDDETKVNSLSELKVLHNLIIGNADNTNRSNVTTEGNNLNALETCKLHPTQKLSHFIEETKEIICVYCAFNKFKKSPNLEIKEISERVNEINEDLNKIHLDNQEFEENIQLLMSDLKSTKREEEKKVNNLFDSIIGFLEEKRKETVESIKTNFSKNAENFSKKQDYFINKMEEAENLKAAFEAVVNNSSSKFFEVSSKYKSYLAEISNLSNSSVEITDYKFVSEDTTKLKRFITNFADLKTVDKTIPFVHKNYTVKKHIMSAVNTSHNVGYSSHNQIPSGSVANNYSHNNNNVGYSEQYQIPSSAIGGAPNSNYNPNANKYSHNHNPSTHSYSGSKGNNNSQGNNNNSSHLQPSHITQIHSPNQNQPSHAIYAVEYDQPHIPQSNSELIRKHLENKMDVKVSSISRKYENKFDDNTDYNNPNPNQNQKGSSFPSNKHALQQHVDEILNTSEFANEYNEEKNSNLIPGSGSINNNNTNNNNTMKEYNNTAKEYDTNINRLKKDLNKFQINNNNNNQSYNPEGVSLLNRDKDRERERERVVDQVNSKKNKYNLENEDLQSKIRKESDSQSLNKQYSFNRNLDLGGNRYKNEPEQVSVNLIKENKFKQDSDYLKFDNRENREYVRRERENNNERQYSRKTADTINFKNQHNFPTQSDELN